MHCFGKLDCRHVVREFNSINLVQSLQLAFTEKAVIFINASYIESVNLKAYDKGLQREEMV